MQKFCLSKQTDFMARGGTGLLLATTDVRFIRVTEVKDGWLVSRKLLAANVYFSKVGHLTTKRLKVQQNKYKKTQNDTKR